MVLKVWDRNQPNYAFPECPVITFWSCLWLITSLDHFCSKNTKFVMLLMLMCPVYMNSLNSLKGALIKYRLIILSARNSRFCLKTLIIANSSLHIRNVLKWLWTSIYSLYHCFRTFFQNLGLIARNSINLAL